jgi:hypothetical protein
MLGTNHSIRCVDVWGKTTTDCRLTVKDNPGSVCLKAAEAEQGNPEVCLENSSSVLPEMTNRRSWPQRLDRHDDGRLVGQADAALLTHVDLQSRVRRGRRTEGD